MGVYYKVYVGSPTGTPRTIHIPNFSTDESLSGTYNIISATTANPRLFDQTYTIFCISTSSGMYRQYGELLTAQGFTDIVNLPLSSEPYEYWYFNETHRLQLNGTGVSYEVLSSNTWTTLFSAGTFGGIGWDRCCFSAYTLSQDGTSTKTSLLTFGARYSTEFEISTITGSALPNKTAIYNYFNGITPFIPSTDPYADLNDTSTTGGGGGIGVASDTSDTIDFPATPSLDAVSTGFINLFTPTLSQLNSLASWMWDDTNDIVNNILKLFTNPMEVILGLSILGVTAPTSGSSTVQLGNVSTNVSMDKLSSQFFTVDCGTLNVLEIWGAYVDYAPYTKASIYLPFIGTHQINIDEIMDKSVHLIYTIDALSGACVANLKCDDAILYSYIGQCSASIPITGSDYTNMINGIISIAGSVGSMIASGGATAPLVLPAMASNAVNNLKPDIQHSGSLSGTGGIMGVKTAYLIFERPNLCLTSYQNKSIGYPSYIYENVGDLSGYTVFEEIKIQGNSHMTQGELEEIDKIMKTGVFL